jgi:hypothetical protein
MNGMREQVEVTPVGDRATPRRRRRGGARGRGLSIGPCAVVALAAAWALWVFAPGAVRAQGQSCSQRTYHHLGCDDRSSPDRGKWAWNPGEPSNWPGLGVSGNVHWWVQFGWYDAARLNAARGRDGDMPGIEFEFYDPGRHCGCTIDVLKVRLRHTLNAPPANAMEITGRRGDCPGSNRSLMKIRLKSTGWISRGVNYDLSVDAQSQSGRTTGGEANMSWEGDGSGWPTGGCLDNPRAEVWLGKVTYCVDLRGRESDPNGICCSTSRFNPTCPWAVCD